MAEGSGDPARRHLSREASHGGGGAETASSEAEISWERLSHWLCCMCVVTFDLELGQAMEVRAAPPRTENLWRGMRACAREQIAVVQSVHQVSSASSFSSPCIRIAA